MKVVLIKPPIRRLYFPVGLCYLASMLRQQGVEVMIMDFDREKEWIRKIWNFSPDLIGITVASYSLITVIKIVAELRQVTQAPIVVGGSHISIIKEKIFDFLDVEYAVVGEGEDTLLELCRAVQEQRGVDTIKGLLYKAGSIVKNNGPRPWLEDLDSLTFPAWDLLHFERVSSLPVLVSRGCPYSCIYCCVGLLEGKTVRYRTPENVIAEIENGIKKFGGIEFVLRGDNILIRKEIILEICDLLMKKNIKIRWLLSDIRSDLLDKQILRVMKAAGCKLLSFGVESGSDNVLTRVKKGENISKIKESILMAKKEGFIVDAHLMVGNPGDSPEAAKKTAALLWELKPNRIFINLVVPYPGTELWDWVHREGKILYKDEFDFPSHIQRKNVLPYFETDDFTWEERVKVYKWLKTNAAVIMLITNILEWPRIIHSFSLRRIISFLRNKLFHLKFNPSR